VDFTDIKNYGQGSSLTLGYNSKALVQDIFIDNNLIIGKNNALNILHAKSVVFKNNKIYSGYIHFGKSTLQAIKSSKLDLDNNKFYTRKLAGYRFIDHKDYKLSEWQKIYGLDIESQWNKLKKFEIHPVLKVQQLKTNSNHFNIALLDKEGNDVSVDFSNHNVEEGMTYKIYDIENPSVVIKSGEISKDLKIVFPMGLKVLEKPLHNKLATKTADNFGVFRIEFTEKSRRNTFFGRLFGWLF
jgi:hypothetical protein